MSELKDEMDRDPTNLTKHIYRSIALTIGILLFSYTAYLSFESIDDVNGNTDYLMLFISIGTFVLSCTLLAEWINSAIPKTRVSGNGINRCKKLQLTLPEVNAQRYVVNINIFDEDEEGNREGLEFPLDWDNLIEIINSLDLIRELYEFNAKIKPAADDEEEDDGGESEEKEEIVESEFRKLIVVDGFEEEKKVRHLYS